MDTEESYNVNTWTLKRAIMYCWYLAYSIVIKCQLLQKVDI